MPSYTVTKMALVVCILGALAASAQTQSYLLRSEGSVSVNGAAVPTTALVSDGDVIQTGKGSTAKIAAPGMAMLVGENSRVAVGSGKLAVDHGSASIASRGQVSTVSSHYAIKPASSDFTRYLVSNNGGYLSVISASGALSVTGPDTLAKGVSSGQGTSFALGDYRGGAANAGTSQPRPFAQLLGPPTSNVCRTAAICYCKTAAHCPGKDLQ